MRKVIIALVTLIIIITNINVIYGLENDYIVRIRVRKPRQENEQVKIGGNNFKVLNFKNSLEEELCYFEGKEIAVRIDSYYDQDNNFQYFNAYSNKVDIGPYHLKVDDYNYNSYADVLNRIEELSEQGIRAYPYYNSQDFEVWIGMFVNESEASEKKRQLKSEGIKTDIIKDDNDRIIIYDDLNNVIFAYNNDYNIFISSFDNDLEKNAVNVDGKKYRGMIGFFIIEDYKLVTINRLDVESYLYGVIPNEMSPSWPIEALKAQVLAARTYAISNINPNASYGYDMVDNQNSQVYRGFESEQINSNQAVDETAGEMIYHSGSLINAYFHSTSGGKTENSENVWTYSLPYVRGVDDEYSNISPYSTWNKIMNTDKIIEKLKEDGNEANKIYDIKLTEISENNRILKTLIETDCENIEYQKETIRKVLGYDFLLSTWFDVDYNNKKTFVSTCDVNVNNNEEDKEMLKTVEQKSEDKIYGKKAISADGIKEIKSENASLISDKTKEETLTYPSEYYFNGRGWGHGIGLSQYGAKQMAIEGFTYDEILKHYYSGVEIK